MRLGSPKRSVERASKFGGVAHERHSIAIASIHESALDRFDATVHHITGCNAVGTSTSICNCDLGNTFHRWWGIDRTVVMEEAAVSVVGVFAQTNVACDIEVGIERTQFFDS